MLCEHRDDHGGIFRALTFVDGRGICRHQRVEFAKSVVATPASRLSPILLNIALFARAQIKLADFRRSP